MPKDAKDVPLRGDMIRKGFGNFVLPGLRAHTALIEYLEDNGIILDDTHFHTLREIEMQLQEVFGPMMAPVVIKLLENGIELQRFK